MTQRLTLTRSEAEWLVELLEDEAAGEMQKWRLWMADDIRKLFSMPKRTTGFSVGADDAK